MAAWDPQGAEPELYKRWEEAGLFTADANSARPKFVISMPPPNLTGELHLGHAQYAIQDLYCRYKRMQGFETLWVPGTDHAALATNALIERQLLAEGTTKEKIGRPAFDRRVEKWFADYGGRIIEQLKRLGFSADWTRLRFTMDPAYVRAVRTAFVRLYDEGLIYRGLRIINWCPNCKSSVSDLEIDWREHEDVLYYIRYEMAGGGELVIATVRPETMLADTGVAVHPEDKARARFVGRMAILPLVGRELPVVADEAVDPEFGTGALKVTPGHDPMDYEIGQRHGLEVLSAIDKDGNIVVEEWVPDELRSLNSLDARRRIVELLRETDHLVRTEPYVHEVGHCDRCGEILQPIVDDQWFCAMSDLAKPAIKVVEEGKVRFEPEKWNKYYLDWMYNLRDWNISRQIWLGHRIPVYTCGNGHVFASIAEPASCAECESTELEQDPDVLDTWFSSALWPFATLGWPEETEDLKIFYPTQLLDTAYEIIRLWVARMIMTGLKFAGGIPFDTVLIHAVIQDPTGQRMSKSKGNGVDPLEMVAKYGADAVRAWSLEVALPRQAARWDESRIESYQRFANKLWNITNLVEPVLRDTPHLTSPRKSPPESGFAGTRTRGEELVDPFDRWILARYDGLVNTVTGALDRYRPGDALVAIYEFTWHEFADWYLELAKPRFRLDASDPERAIAAGVALEVLDGVVRLLHPFMPFVSEAVWDRLPGERPMLMERTPSPLWPAAPEAPADPELTGSVEALFELIRQLRDARKDAGFRENERAKVIMSRVADDPAGVLIGAEAGRAAIAQMAVIDLVDATPNGVVRTLVSSGYQLKIAAPERAEVMPSGEELKREIERTRDQIAQLESQLANQQFVSKAKPEIVEAARARLAKAVEHLRALENAAGA